MIRTESEYQTALARLGKDREVIDRQRADFETEGLTSEELERAMEPLLSFHEQLKEEVDWYERVSRGDVPPLTRLTDIGRTLIALRIASGLTQRAFAEMLQVSESVVSRDERNEYHGITVERAQRIFDVLRAELTARIAVSRSSRSVAGQKSLVTV